MLLDNSCVFPPVHENYHQRMEWHIFSHLLLHNKRSETQHFLLWVNLILCGAGLKPHERSGSKHVRLWKNRKWHKCRQHVLFLFTLFSSASAMQLGLLFVLQSPCTSNVFTLCKPASRNKSRFREAALSEIMVWLPFSLGFVCAQCTHRHHDNFLATRRENAQD